MVCQSRWWLFLAKLSIPANCRHFCGSWEQHFFRVKRKSTGKKDGLLVVIAVFSWSWTTISFLTRFGPPKKCVVFLFRIWFEWVEIGRKVSRMGGAGQNFGDQKQPQKLDKVQYLESLNHSQIDPRDPHLRLRPTAGKGDIHQMFLSAKPFK